MRGKSARGGGVVVKLPRSSLSPDPGPMNTFVIQGGNGDRQTTEKQQNMKGRHGKKEKNIF